MTYPLRAEDIAVQVVESREEDRLITELVIFNQGDEPLTQNWRLYFSLGLTPAPEETSVQQVLLDGRYGYLQPGETWQTLAPGDQHRIRVNNWLFSGMPLAAQQGFHLGRLDPGDNQDRLIGRPVELPAKLAPIRLENKWITDTSPSADTAVLTPEYMFDVNAETKADGSGFFVIPAIASLDPDTESFSVEGFSMVPRAVDGLKNEADCLRSHLDASNLIKDGGTPVSLSLSSSLAPQQYHLVCSPAGISIEGHSSEAVFHGIQTFTQLLAYEDGVCRLPEVDLLDAPDFEHRAVFIDIARHFHDAAQIGKVIQAMSLYKLNRLQLGISNDEGWRLEIPEIPELTGIGATRSFDVTDDNGERRALYPAWGDNDADTSGFITRIEFIELLQLAQQHHVEIILEFNLPGHANAILRAIESTGRYNLVDRDDTSIHRSAQGYTANVMNVCLPDTYRFAADILASFKSAYDEAGVPMQRIHLGGDEVPEGAWLHSPVCRQSTLWDGHWDMDNPDDRQAATQALNRHYFQTVREAVEATIPGITCGFWHEMAQHESGSSGANYFNAWTTEAGQREIVDEVLQSGQQLVISNASYLYLDMPYALHRDEPGLPWAAYISTRHIHNFDPLACWDIAEENTAQVQGLQAQLWSETIYTPALMDYHLFPRLLAFAERCWNSRPAGDWARFAGKVGRRELDALAAYAIQFRIPPPGARIIDGRLHANTSYPHLVIRYTLDGNEPGLDDRVYSGPVEIDSTTVRLAAFHPASGRSSRSVEVS